MAIALALTGVLVFSIYNALGKWLVADYSPWQIIFFRGLFGFTPFLIWGLAVHGLVALRSRLPWWQVLRAVFGLSANLFFIFAYRELPLADAVAIGYAAPVFVVVLSAPLLAERVSARRSAAAFVGFLGILLIAQPGAGILTAGALYALAGTMCYALLVIVTRRVGMLDDALCTVLWTSGLYALACLAALPAVWVTPSAVDLGLLIAVGVIGSSGLLLFAQAYRLGEAAVLAPFDYTSMLWAALFGFILWGEVPAPTAIAGMVIIAGSGVFLIRAERPRRHLPGKP